MWPKSKEWFCFIHRALMCTMCANMWTIVNWNRKHCTTLKLKNVKQRKAFVQICVQICVQMCKLVILLCTPPSSSPKWPNSKRCENVYKGMKTFPGRNVSQLCRDVLLCSSALPPNDPILNVATHQMYFQSPHHLICCHINTSTFQCLSLSGNRGKNVWKYEEK